MARLMRVGKILLPFCSPQGGRGAHSASPLLLVFKSFPSTFPVSTLFASQAPGVVGKKHEKRGTHPESAMSFAQPLVCTSKNFMMETAERETVWGPR